MRWLGNERSAECVYNITKFAPEKQKVKNMKKLALLFVLMTFLIVGTNAQPRIVEKKAETPTPAAIAPVTFKAKYEGGMFGFSQKQEGTLKFDDANLRLVFFDKQNKEKFGIPYTALVVVYPNKQSVQSGTGRVVQNIPVLGAGIAGAFMKKKIRYLVINFDDQDMNARGTANFRLDSSELLESVIQTLGTKAEMQQRGDAYYRPVKKGVPMEQ
jgi:hypothetical protein